MLLLDALFINNSGGKVLLDYLVEKLEQGEGKSVFYLFDERCSSSYQSIPADRKLFLEGNFFKRVNFYRKRKELFTRVICFGNIPPGIKLNVPVYTYFHNVSLFTQPSNYRWREKLTKVLKGIIIKFYAANTNYFVVQTAGVKSLLTTYIGIDDKKCLIMPFYRPSNNNNNDTNKRKSFVYISNGNTHKNHRNLIDAWYLLSEKGLFPELNLTVTESYPDLISIISKAVIDGINIINHGFIDPLKLYNSNRYLIYPSLCESFGLGLIEAVESGCDVIASDLPFVYEVVKPTAVFDPQNPESICATVQQVLSTTPIVPELVVTNKIDELTALLLKCDK